MIFNFQFVRNLCPIFLALYGIILKIVKWVISNEILDQNEMPLCNYIYNSIHLSFIILIRNFVRFQTVSENINIFYLPSRLNIMDTSGWPCPFAALKYFYIECVLKNNKSTKSFWNYPTYTLPCIILDQQNFKFFLIYCFVYSIRRYKCWDNNILR